MGNNIKLILFDLDGVITDTKEIHYISLNDAIAEVDSKYIITQHEHLTKYDGLKTLTKLEMLTQFKGLPVSSHKQIYDTKQKYTLKEFSKIQPDDSIVNIFKQLKEDGYLIGCCTNCIRRTALVALAKTCVIEYLDVIVTNDDVKNSKPHPEIYWKGMSMMGCLPEETLIVEDSPQGLLAATRSKASVLRVKNSKDLTLDKVYTILKNTKRKTMNKWTDEKLNVVIPMAGAGSRFEKAGYTFPKPLIDVNGKPMIQLVVESMNIDATFIYIVQKSHREKYNLDTLLNLITPGCKIVEVDGLTEGAACTVLLAKEYINNENQLILTNSDQFIEWNSTDFMYQMNEKNFDGGIMCFEATHPKWSFAKTDETGIITEVAEKNPISNQATAGIYYWKHGSDFVKYTEQMIDKNIRVNNEFYVCPVYNEAIEDGKVIFNYEIPTENMWGLGTPEDLKYYLENYNDTNIT
jgi:HAD superfamily hydrolase (TIGR01509 family)